MIAHSDDQGAQLGGELGANIFTECCDIEGDEDEECENRNELWFPSDRTCDFLGIAFCKFDVSGPLHVAQCPTRVDANRTELLYHILSIH